MAQPRISACVILLLYVTIIYCHGYVYARSNAYTTFVDTNQCKNMQDLRDVIPSTTLAYITSKHYDYDVKFRYAMQFMRTTEFKNVVHQIETSSVYLDVLKQFSNVGINTAYMRNISDILVCLLMPTSDKAVTTATTAASTTTVCQNGASALVTESTTLQPNVTNNMISPYQLGGGMEIAFLLKLNGFANSFDSIAPVTHVPVTVAATTPAANCATAAPVVVAVAPTPSYIMPTTSPTVTTASPINIYTKEINFFNPFQTLTTTMKSIVEQTTTPEIQATGKIHNNATTTANDNDANELKETTPVPIARMARSMQTFMADIMNAIPRKEFRELITRKLLRDRQFAQFYKKMRSRTFKHKLFRQFSSKELANSLTVMKNHYIDVHGLVQDIFKIFSLGP